MSVFLRPLFWAIMLNAIHRNLVGPEWCAHERKKLQKRALLKSALFCGISCTVLDRP